LAITTNKIIDEAVETNKIKNKAITTDKIADKAITADKIANNSVKTESIVNGAITEGKLGTTVIKNINGKLAAENPMGTGALSLNRKKDSVIG
jgi:hypothetical protein